MEGCRLCFIVKLLKSSVDFVVLCFFLGKVWIYMYLCASKESPPFVLTFGGVMVSVLYSLGTNSGNIILDNVKYPNFVIRIKRCSLVLSSPLLHFEQNQII